jgi:hypothetical protein
MKLGTLFTCANMREISANIEIAARYNLPIIVDSGAWSNFTGKAQVTVESHVKYLQSNWVKGARYISLDVIGNEKESLQNWLIERDKGLNVEPTIHFGSSPDAVDRYLSYGLATEWVNLGGMAQHQGNTKMHKQLAGWSASVMRRCPEGTKFHALGGTAPALNQLIKYDSVDSTYWLQVYKWNTLPVFDPSVPRYYIVPRSLKSKEWDSGKKQRLGKLGPLVKKQLGVNAVDLLNATEEVLAEFAMIGNAQFGQYFEQRHKHSMFVYLAGSNERHYQFMSKLNGSKA